MRFLLNYMFFGSVKEWGYIALNAMVAVHAENHSIVSLS